ncbi:hypothetical protein HBO43_22470 [Pseudomonas veronii]|uniref:Phage tail protein n=1 Tax=Pseudomonas veronii TaxID=76761 RepID=A0A7Y0ZWQ1_PSEVE|nr:hypothetical protein [Pseudomonas veronii]NMX99359.1 hypothetical protein [Pseudomonas veronii]
MYQIDNSTAATTIPAPTPAGSPGFFTDGNPATGVAATIMPAEFMNALMMENLNVLSAAGIAPAKGQYNQLALAISKIVSSGTSWDKITNKPTTLSGFGITDGLSTGSYASQAEAEAGASADKVMSPLRTSQAITAKIQSSSTDTTPNKLLVTGSFGLGTTYSSGPKLLTDMSGSQVSGSGLYTYSSATTGKPSFGSSFGSVQHVSVSSDANGNYATQFAIDYASDAAGFRRSSGASGWQPWREIWHSGNLGLANETNPGIQRISTQAQANAGTDDATSISPKKLAAWASNKFIQATEAIAGLIKIATTSQVLAGSDDTSAITPLKLSQVATKNATDTTAKLLLRVGDFGVGGTYSNGAPYAADISGTQIAGSGLYRYDSSTISRPSFGGGFGSIQHASLASDGAGNYGTELAIDYASDAIGFRRMIGSSGWRPWVELFHRGNLGPATTSTVGLTQLGTMADVLAGTSPTLVAPIAALIAGLLGAGGRTGTDYLIIPYIDKNTGVRRNKILQWTTTPALTNSSSYTWTYPAAFATGIHFMSGMMIGTTSGTLQTTSAGLTSALFSNGTNGSNNNTAFVFVIGE